MFDKETIDAARLLPVQPPEALAEQVLRHQRAHSAANRVAHDEFSAVPWESRRTMPAYWRARADARHERDQQRIASCRLALDFVEPRGWTISERRFGVQCLARGGVHDGKDMSALLRHEILDHAYCFKRDRYAAAIAAHLYEGAFAEHRARCEALAARYGLALEIPDYPSWYYPGATRFVLYIGPVGRAAS